MKNASDNDRVVKYPFNGLKITESETGRFWLRRMSNTITFFGLLFVPLGVLDYQIRFVYEGFIFFKT